MIMHAGTVERRSLLIGPILLVALFAALAGCGAEAERPTAEPIHDLGEPWQPHPFAIAREVLDAALQACRTIAPEGIAPNAVIVLADARGADRIDLLLAAPGGRTTRRCTAVRSPAGTFEITAAATDDQWGPAAPGEVLVGSVTMAASIGPEGIAAETGYLNGVVGPGVARVDVILARVGTIEAATANGWFSAWWPSGEPNVRVQPFGLDAQPLGPPHG
jgi:hypothetical protein